MIKKLKYKVQNLRRRRDFSILDCFNEIDIFTSGSITHEKLKKFMSLNANCSDYTIISSIIKKTAPTKDYIDISDFYTIFEIYTSKKIIDYQTSVSELESRSNSKFISW